MIIIIATIYKYFRFQILMFGNIHWNGSRFVGDTPATTDILGPFYRPYAAVRININPPVFTGEPLYLSGTVFKVDMKTPWTIHESTNHN
jgi:hypothetical protein